MTNFKWLTFCGTAALAVTLSVVAPAHSNSRNDRFDRNGRNDRQQTYQNSQRHDQFHRFDDHDRRAFREWYSHNRSNAPWVRDRFPSNIRFTPGVVVKPEYRRWYRPVPTGLVRLMPVAPRGFRYVMIGNQIVLLDNRNVVRDGFSFQFSF